MKYDVVTLMLSMINKSPDWLSNNKIIKKQPEHFPKYSAPPPFRGTVFLAFIWFKQPKNCHFISQGNLVGHTFCWQQRNIACTKLLCKFIVSSRSDDYYRPQTKLREGNVFTLICLFTGGVSSSPGQTPPGIRPSRARQPLWDQTPWEQTSTPIPPEPL